MPATTAGLVPAGSRRLETVRVGRADGQNQRARCAPFLVLGLIALVVVVSLTIIGGGISDVFDAIALAIQNGV